MKNFLYSAILSILALGIFCSAAPVRLVDEVAVSVNRLDSNTIIVDFGRTSFGNIHLNTPANADCPITIRFGECLQSGRINRSPLGSVRFAEVRTQLEGLSSILVTPPPDGRNTQTSALNLPPAVATPLAWGTLLPFRWVEIEGWPGEFLPEQIIRKSAFSLTWDDAAASFDCSDKMLNQIWELCRYTIKATTFAGIYVDGDRERIPYEGDAYFTQLSHYATDYDVQMARDTFDYLIKNPTWPTEWSFHMIFMAHAEFMHTGDIKWLSSRYESLKSKLLLSRAREDGLLVSNVDQINKFDIVDWPKSERDDYVFKPVNTVVNAFHIRSLELMAELADGIGKKEDAISYRAMASKALLAFQRILYDPAEGAYRDGEGTDHHSQHASLFPLAFGLVPHDQVPAAVEFVKNRGMSCSVYAAQYLMQGLFTYGCATEAINLITAPTDRSWRHMVDSGATITWEAWDFKYKPNQDWSHAWGAAPANLLPRYILGVEPLSPGWKKVGIRPQIGGLSFAKGKIPTPRGQISLDWENETSFRMNVTMPEGMTAMLELPAPPSSKGVMINGKKVPAKRVGSSWLVEEMLSGCLSVQVDPS
jgi:hypothetical protein